MPYTKLRSYRDYPFISLNHVERPVLPENDILSWEDPATFTEIPEAVASHFKSNASSFCFEGFEWQYVDKNLYKRTELSQRSRIEIQLGLFLRNLSSIMRSSTPVESSLLENNFPRTDSNVCNCLSILGTGYHLFLDETFPQSDPFRIIKLRLGQIINPSSVIFLGHSGIIEYNGFANRNPQDIEKL